VELLEAQGIRCERKSVYSDIEALGALGYDIKLRRGRGGGYFLQFFPVIGHKGVAHLVQRPAELVDLGDEVFFVPEEQLRPHL
ncbi:hypothetical protein R2O95_14405, partial [Faecalibacterium duncaniae]|nr:hypothetical protein [Faecalibacterium duncaniae]